MKSFPKLTVVLASLVACRSPPEKIYGQPIGIRVPSGERTLMATVAVREGENIDPYVEGLAGALSKAAKVCLQNGQIALEFEIVEGTIRSPNRSEIESVKCLADTLNGKTIGKPETTPLHARMRMAAQ